MSTSHPVHRFRGRIGTIALSIAAGFVMTACQDGTMAPQAPADAASAPAPYSSWRAYAGGSHSSQFSALDQVNRSNVSQLEVAWTYPLGPGTVTFNPIIIDDVLYARGRGNSIVALDAATGEEIWNAPADGMIGARGFHYWQSEDSTDRRLLFLANGMLTAINADNGAAVATFGSQGRVDLREGLRASGRDAARPLHTSNPGRVFENIFIISLPAQGTLYESTPGNVQGYDVRTGELLWTFHSIPHPGEHGYDTWPEGHYRHGGGVHNWAELTIDEQRGIAFIPFGSPRFDFYGGDRAGDNLYGNSLVALDARTGQRLWHYQIVRHDLWDYDLPNAPKLMTLRRDGRDVDVVVQVAKQGLIFVFDRETGEPFFPIEDRPVPSSDVPGEHASATQPFPTRPPRFGRQTFTVDDINPFLPEQEQAALRERMQYWRNEGLYTPPSFEGSIQMPGHNGGANWGSVGADPVRGELYVISKNMPTLLRVTLPGGPVGDPMGGNGGFPEIVTPDEAAQLRATVEARMAAEGLLQLGAPYEFIRSPSTGATSIGPPWAEITAYDMNTGTIKWRRPHGSVDAPPQAGIPADAGAHMPRGGPLVTAGGLVFAATASDQTLWAYDRDTGDVVWSTRLPSGSEGIPAAYRVNGRQYIVFPVASPNGLFPPDFAAILPDALQRDAAGDEPVPQGAYIAFALPD